MITVQLYGVLSLLEFVDTVVALWFTFRIILDCHVNSYRPLATLGLAIGIGKSRVVERPHVSCLYTVLLRVLHEDVNLRPDGAIRGKRRIVG
jgi:hypothetical protein